MTFFDFLFAIGFWQWVGVICLASVLAGGIGATVGAVLGSRRSDK